MARNRKPRKKYQPKQKALDLLMGNLRITALESYGKDENGDGIYRSNMPFAVVEQAVDTPRRWFIEAVVVCDPGSGQDLYEEVESFLTDPVRINDIADEILAAIERIKRNDVNHKQIIDWGWRARLVTPQLLKELEREEREAA